MSPIKSKRFDALEQCRKLVVEFQTDPKHHTYAQFFLTPVDPIALQCPTYFDIIKRPMDLSTILSKLDNNQYTSEEDFAFDMRLMFENCYTFNGRNHQIAPFCQLFQDAFEEKYSRIKKALEKSKFTLLDKIKQTKATVKKDIEKYENILEELKEKLEVIEKQEKEEEEKLREMEENFMPKEKSIKKEKSKSKPIIIAQEMLIQKVKKKPSKDEIPKRKRPRKFRPPQNPRSTSPPPLQPPQQQLKQQSAEPHNKSDSEEDDSASSMTYEEMRNLSIAINALSQNHLHEVLGILKKYQPKETAAQNNELEIDFQSLKPVTLRVLEKFIADCNKPKPGKTL